AEPVSRRGQRAEGRGRSGARPEVDGRPVLRKTFERGAPVANPLLGPAVEFLGRGAAILGKRRRIQRRDRGVAPRRIDQEVVPERAGVAERAGDVDSDRVQRHALTAMPPRMAAPAVSMSQSTGEPCRPDTKVWWNSSVTA